MSAVEQVGARLERGFRGPAWHGPSLSEVLLRLAPEQATARPVAGGHSIAELVRHVAAWKRLVAGWARGEPRQRAVHRAAANGCLDRDEGETERGSE